MQPVALFVLSMVLSIAYMASITPKEQIYKTQPRSGNGQLFQNLKGGIDKQPTDSVSPGKDPVTGLPVLWVRKVNGTSHMRFLDKNGNALGSVPPAQQ